MAQDKSYWQPLTPSEVLLVCPGKYKCIYDFNIQCPPCRTRLDAMTPAERVAKLISNATE